MMLVTLTMLTMAAQPTPDRVPDWTIRGMLRTETSSVMIGSRIVRKDWRNDRDSLGVLQIRKIAWKDVSCHFPGRKHSDLAYDDQLSIKAAKAFLCRYYTHKTGWNGAVMAFNAGPGNKSPQYLAKVIKYGRK